MDSNRTLVTYTKLSMSFISLIAGLVLLFVGMFLPPSGEIHSSVLVAFGEAATFAGAILGIHFSYASKLSELETELEKTKSITKKE